jgi:hypothetical protein
MPQSIVLCSFVRHGNNKSDRGHRSGQRAGSTLLGGLLFAEARMKTLPEVETAKQLMNEAARWSVMRWLREKKRVRKTADHANAALDRVSEELRQRWPDNIKAAYHALGANEADSSRKGNTGQKTTAKNSREFVVARQLKDADDKAFRARMAAEKTFDDAEKRLSTSLAREGCQKAILSWELHERAIAENEKVCP